MQCVTLNETGNFDIWEPEKLEELENSHLTYQLGDKLLYEDKSLRVWQIALYPQKRLPFRKINTNFSLVSVSSGVAITRCGDGSITMLHLKKGDTAFIPLESTESIYDLENIGQHVLLLHIMEFSSIIMEDYLNSTS